MFKIIGTLGSQTQIVKTNEIQQTNNGKELNHVNKSTYQQLVIAIFGYYSTYFL